ncbi:MAG: molybdopterin-dependent oxidoreductase [Vicinamibacterales bacterium]
MSKIAQVALFAVTCTLTTAAYVAAQTSIAVIGLDGRKVAVSLQGLERQTVVTGDRAGIKTTHEGVLLRDVLAKAGVPLGETLRGNALARAVLATADDGYQVAYSIAEVDEAFNDFMILIVDRRDGQPLLPDSGPLQIVVPQDKRPARWIKQVTTLEVRQLP